MGKKDNDVRRSMFVGDLGIQSVAKWCKEFGRLSLSGLPLVSDNGLSFVVQTTARKLLCLSIESCRLIGNESMGAIASKLLKLTSISIVKCPLVENSGIVSLVLNLRQLKTLKLEMMKIGDEVLRAVKDYARALKVLHLEKMEGPTEMGYSFIQSIEELRSLRLRLSIGLTEERMRWASVKSFTKLNSLMIERCGSLTDKVMIDLSKSAKLVENLSLDECSGFTCDGITEVMSIWRETLKVISLYKCRVTEISIIVPLVKKNHPCLTRLEFRECSGIGDELLTRIGLSFNSVSDVSLVGMNSFTDQGLLYLFIKIQNSNQLTSLYLSGCTTVSSCAIYSVLEVFGKTLKLGGCNGVDDQIMFGNYESLWQFERAEFGRVQN